MALEIERKFLVLNEDYKKEASAAINIRQGYLSRVPERTVRIRIKGEKAFITVKGKSCTSGMARFEWEHEIDICDAEELMKLCEGNIIEKTRYIVPVGKYTFEVDEFHGNLSGKTLAEIELDNADEEFDHPSWLGCEVTGNPAWYNSAMSGSH